MKNPIQKHKWPVLSWSLLMLGLLSGYGMTAEGNTYYVSKSGSDGNAGTLSSPWQTIQKAANRVAPGDMVLIRGGTYTESVTLTRSGTTSGIITLKNYNSEAVTITGGKGIFMNGQKYITLDGLKITNSRGYGIQAISGEYITLRNCEVSYTQDGGVVFEAGYHITVDKCNIHHTNQRGFDAAHEAVSFRGVDTFEIKNSQVHDSKEEGIDAKYNARNGKIHDNKVSGNNGPNIYIDSAHDIAIFNNTVYNAKGNDKAGIQIAVESTWNSGHYRAYNINIYNNHIYNNPTAGFAIWTEDGAYWTKYTNIKFVNNIVESNGNPYTLIAVWDSKESYFGTGNIIENNIFKNPNGVELNVRGFSIGYNIIQTDEMLAMSSD